MRGRNGLLMALALQLVLAGTLSAQAMPQEPKLPGFDILPRIGIGYVANAPDVLTGAAAWAVFDVLGGLGLYVDYKAQLSTPADDEQFLSGVTPADAESDPDQSFVYDESTWWSANAALVRPLSNELMIYLGAGYSERRVFNRYQDVRGDFVPADFVHSHYWVEDDLRTEGRLNVLGGAFIRFGSAVAFQLGVETEPFGFTVGASYMLAP